MTWVGQQELLILEGEQVSLVSEVRGGRNRSGPVSGWEATCTRRPPHRRGGVESAGQLGWSGVASAG